MLNAAITFFIIGLAAFILGATGIAGLSMEAGKLMLIVFCVLAALSFIIRTVTGRQPKNLL